ncbi:hypothetical protein AgCh_036760 [Apium graveolens]
MTEMSDVDEEDIKQTLTVRDITLLTETHVQREVVCKVMIDKVNEDANCFRLETRCSNDTGSLTIVLPHATIAQIAQKTVEDLYSPDKEELGEQQFPPYLRMFEKQKYNMTVIITEENVVNGSEVYEATRIGNKNKSSGTFTPCSNQTIETNEMLAMNVSMNEDTLMQALNTAKSTSKKVRARKLHAPVPFDEEGRIQKEPKSGKAVKNIMFKAKFDELSSLKVGKFDWKIRVRVIRFWRGATRKGEIFKSFNIILFIDKNSRMHAFIRGNADDVLEDKFTMGKCYIIRKFVVQAYKPDDKFLCLANDVQLVFSKDTQMKEIEERKCHIETNAFDFYDHSELMELTKQTTHLAEFEEDRWYCMHCNRILPCPDKRYKVTVKASDNTGCIDIILNGQQVRAVIGKRVVHLLKQMGEDKSFSSELKTLVNRKYTIKFIIKKFNVLDKATTYFTTNICTGFIDPNQDLTDGTTYMQQHTPTVGGKFEVQLVWWSTLMDLLTKLRAEALVVDARDFVDAYAVRMKNGSLELLEVTIRVLVILKSWKNEMNGFLFEGRHRRTDVDVLMVTIQPDLEYWDEGEDCWG